ncbi:hypothetical protein [Nocardioides sp. GY 10127]|uniref:hypothetical protein n=1 Tax=Nocardioides sp. GY 10127 TaxID=2569762 RepID=UPI0010A8B7B5|nr:hypothetical protein [Nocardioides sp. GY 10127]TIC81647.1 hypothetical protein E8D37_10615 [Nocardioides sp. GY 10127]
MPTPAPARRPAPPRRLLAAALACLLLPALAACGGSAEQAGSDASDADPVVIDVRITDDSVDPSGERVEVGAGQTVVLAIDADSAGSLHVHSSPAQEVDYPAGTSEQRLVITVPGLVEIESHALDQVIVQLEVR